MDSFVSVLLVFAAIVCSAHSTPQLRPRPCPGGLTPISDLQVSSKGVQCERFPCVLFKGEDTLISLKVNTDKDVAAGTPAVLGTVGGVPLPWSVPAAEGYPQVTKEGDVSTYVMKFPVSAMYPSVRSTVTWKLNLEDGTNIFCFRMAVVLKAE